MDCTSITIESNVYVLRRDVVTMDCKTAGAQRFTLFFYPTDQVFSFFCEKLATVFRWLKIRKANEVMFGALIKEAWKDKE